MLFVTTVYRRRHAPPTAARRDGMPDIERLQWLFIDVDFDRARLSLIAVAISERRRHLFAGTTCLANPHNLIPGTDSVFSKPAFFHLQRVLRESIRWMRVICPRLHVFNVDNASVCANECDG